MKQDQRKKQKNLAGLVKKVRRYGDADAFVELMELCRESMIKVAKSYLPNEEDAADAVQDAILTCYEKLDTLKNPEYFRTWLIRIVINKCKDFLKTNRPAVSLEDAPELHAWDYTQEHLEFMELLQSMDEKYRTILVLYYSEGFRTSEIADLLELNENTVRTRLARARAQFARQYQEEEELNARPETAQEQGRKWKGGDAREKTAGFLL